MTSAQSTDRGKLQADIVIVGGGGGGLAAAVAAAESGKINVILVEARRAPGGNAVFPIGIFAAESRIQKRQAIDARTDNLVKSAVDYAHGKVNPKLVRTLVAKSGDTIDWLESNGVQFAAVVLHYPNQVPAVFHIVSPPGRTGSSIVKALRKRCADLGVQILCQTEGRQLLTDNKGNVTGILARTRDKEFTINAGSVIIATGGFAGNEELMKKHFPAYDKGLRQPMGFGYQGDGLRIVTEVGGAEDDVIALEMGGPRYIGPASIAAFADKASAIWVNRYGERFTDETMGFLFTEGANTLYRQPGKISFTLFDKIIKESVIEEGPNPLAQITMCNTPWPGSLDEDFKSQAEEGTVIMSDSWSEIARWIGAKPEVLQRTIDEYNSSCDRGYDDVFLKDRQYLMPLRNPPYYGIQCGIDITTTHGGIKVNENMEVLNQQDTPISGLYAAGVDIGGTDGDTYNLVLSGHSFGFAVNSGRIAGENAVKYIRSIIK